jgi:hypothetical protein
MAKEPPFKSAPASKERTLEVIERMKKNPGKYGLKKLGKEVPKNAREETVVTTQMWPATPPPNTLHEFMVSEWWQAVAKVLQDKNESIILVSVFTASKIESRVLVDVTGFKLWQSATFPKERSEPNGPPASWEVPVQQLMGELNFHACYLTPHKVILYIIARAADM